MISDFPTDRAEPPAWLTVPLSKAYGAAAAWYHRRYDSIEPYRPPVPVVSVGNIAVGGTGKTPMVIALTRLLWETWPELREPNRIAILSRGYGRESKKLVVVTGKSGWEEAGDEPLLLHRALPEAAVIVHKDRIRGARWAVEKLGARLLLLDDGFQHRRLARDVDMVLADKEFPLGNGYLLPAGPLREPAANLGRATLIFGVGERGLAAAELARKLGKPYAAASPQVRLPVPHGDGSIRKVAVLASIARPTRFVKLLQNMDLEVVLQELFPDHHRYRISELESVALKADRAGANAVITTEKDMARIPSWNFRIPLVPAAYELKISESAAIIDQMTRILDKK